MTNESITAHSKNTEKAPQEKKRKKGKRKVKNSNLELNKFWNTTSVVLSLDQKPSRHLEALNFPQSTAANLVVQGFSQYELKLIWTERRKFLGQNIMNYCKEQPLSKDAGRSDDRLRTAGTEPGLLLEDEVRDKDSITTGETHLRDVSSQGDFLRRSYFQALVP